MSLRSGCYANGQFFVLKMFVQVWPRTLKKKVCLNTAFWLNSQWNYLYERICGEFSKLFSVLCKQMATKSFLTYFNEQCIYRISVVKNILILKRLKGLLIRQIEYLFHWLLNCKCILDIFMDESQTMERSYLWCSFSHFIYILESFWTVSS